MAWENGECLALNRDDEVAHVVGSSAQKGNWKKFWTNHTRKKWPQTCQIHTCGNPATVGAHVYVKRLHQNFILPTCQGCNRDPEQEYGKGWASAKAKAVVARVKPHPNTYDYE